MRMPIIAGLAAGAAAASSNWKIIANDVGTIATGITINGDSKTGFLPADDNGSGATVLMTTDGGFTWAPVKSTAPALLLLDITSYGSNVAVTGTFGQQYSTDGGQTFQKSGGDNGESQCARNLYNHDAPAGFGIAGEFDMISANPINGVAISTDMGATFKATNITTASFPTRYAAFPTETNWVVTAGEWPSNNVQLPSGVSHVYSKTRRFHVGKTSGGRKVPVFGKSAPAQMVGDFNGFAAQIVTTTDGGNTFVSQFNETNAFYFNGVECTDATHCCAVGESDQETISGGTGCHIYCTADLQTWTQNFYNADPNCSIMDIAYAGNNTLWAAGAEYGEIGPTAATYYKSTDMGQTWNLVSQIPNVGATSIDCVVSSGICLSTVVDVAQTSSVASNQ